LSGVTINNIYKEFDSDDHVVHALNGVSLDIEDGEFVCVVGHSGCGKTTLLNILAGFLEPTSGSVAIGGINTAESEQSIGIVFQEYALFAWRTALGNVSFGLEMQGMDKDTARAKSMEFLKLVHLEEFADHYPHELSGGMRQRVAVSRAMTYEPPLLLMDEPFGALDAQTRERLQGLTEEIWQKTEMTIFYVTHNLSEAVYLADRLITLTISKIAITRIGGKRRYNWIRARQSKNVRSCFVTSNIEMLF
jgi:NitT/TauT family transport system ATP-binding protein